MAAALLPSWRSAAFHLLPAISSRSNVTPATFSRLSWITPVWAIPVFRSLLELFPPFLLAVPKKKVSHSRKAMRSANKGLKDKTNIVNCPGCGSAKLAHHLCRECYSSATRAAKARQRNGAVASEVWTPTDVPTVQA